MDHEGGYPWTTATRAPCSAPPGCATEAATGARQEGGPVGAPVGNIVLKRRDPRNDRAEVGYWTTAAARGRGVASRALTALTDRAFAEFVEQGLTRLELPHQVDNEASCRVAEKCGYALARVIAALPPDYPLDGHAHVSEAASVALSRPAGRRAEAAGTGGGRASGR